MFNIDILYIYNINYVTVVLWEVVVFAVTGTSAVLM